MRLFEVLDQQESERDRFIRSELAALMRMYQKLVETSG